MVIGVTSGFLAAYALFLQIHNMAVFVKSEYDISKPQVSSENLTVVVLGIWGTSLLLLVVDAPALPVNVFSVLLAERFSALLAHLVDNRSASLVVRLRAAYKDICSNSTRGKCCLVFRFAPTVVVLCLLCTVVVWAASLVQRSEQQHIRENATKGDSSTYVDEFTELSAPVDETSWGDVQPIMIVTAASLRVVLYAAVLLNKLWYSGSSTNAAMNRAVSYIHYGLIVFMTTLSVSLSTENRITSSATFYTHCVLIMIVMVASIALVATRTNCSGRGASEKQQGGSITYEALYSPWSFALTCGSVVAFAGSSEATGGGMRTLTWVAVGILIAHATSMTVWLCQYASRSNEDSGAQTNTYVVAQRQLSFVLTERIFETLTLVPYFSRACYLRWGCEIASTRWSSDCYLVCLGLSVLCYWVVLVFTPMFWPCATEFQTALMYISTTVSLQEVSRSDTNLATVHNDSAATPRKKLISTEKRKLASTHFMMRVWRVAVGSSMFFPFQISILLWRLAILENEFTLRQGDILESTLQ